MITSKYQDIKGDIGISKCHGNIKTANIKVSNKFLAFVWRSFRFFGFLKRIIKTTFGMGARGFSCAVSGLNFKTNVTQRNFRSSNLFYWDKTYIGAIIRPSSHAVLSVEAKELKNVERSRSELFNCEIKWVMHYLLLRQKKLREYNQKLDRHRWSELPSWNFCESFTIVNWRLKQKGPRSFNFKKWREK